MFRQRCVSVCALMSIVAAAALAQSSTRVPAESNRNIVPAKIGIRNFGRTNENYYRGGQPDTRDYPELAAMGVRTVIDLTRGGRDDEPQLVRQSGMKFYRIPLTTSDRPSEAAVSRFLSLVNDPDNWPVFVHCQGGRHRTGAMTAVYRMTHDAWTADHAYQEMKRYGFEGFPGHPALKSFVYDYYAGLDQVRQAETVQKEEAVGIAK
jgi:tyrosine-protein phosphatase SIW14